MLIEIIFLLLFEFLDDLIGWSLSKFHTRNCPEKHKQIVTNAFVLVFINVLFSRVLGIGFMGSKLSGRLRRLNQQRMCAWSEAYIHVCVLEMDLLIAAL